MITSRNIYILWKSVNRILEEEESNKIPKEIYNSYANIVIEGSEKDIVKIIGTTGAFLVPTASGRASTCQYIPAP
jgi:hypothetical protein